MLLTLTNSIQNILVKLNNSLLNAFLINHYNSIRKRQVSDFILDPPKLHKVMKILNINISHLDPSYSILMPIKAFLLLYHSFDALSSSIKISF